MTNEQIAQLLQDMLDRRGEDDFAITDEEHEALRRAADLIGTLPAESRACLCWPGSGEITSICPIHGTAPNQP